MEKRGNNIPTIIGGDFNARLHGRDVTEEDIMGTHITGKGAEHIVHMTQDTRDNRDRFTTFLEEQGLYINTTNYQKPKNKQHTFRDNAHKHSVQQLDHIIAHQRWKNIITDTDPKPGAGLDSDHTPVVAKLKIKLTKPKDRTIINRPDFNNLNSKQLYQDEIEDQLNGTTIDNIVDILKEASDNKLTKTETKPRKDYISEETWQQIKDRQKQQHN